MTRLKTLLLGRKNRIARRLIVLVIAFSSAITLVISAVQLVFEYRELRGGMDRSLDGASIFVPSLSDSVWNFDEGQIRLALGALQQLPNIEQVVVSMADKDQRWAIGQSASEHVITRTYSLSQLVRGKATEIGTLKVVASLDSIYRRVAAHALAIVLSNALKTFLVALFMVVLLHRVVTSRLERLAHKVSEIGPRLFRMESVQNRSRSTPAHLDELDTVDWILDVTTEELMSAEKRLRLAATAFEAQVGILVTDSRGVILKVNRSFSEMTGYTPEEVIGQNPRFLKSERHDAAYFIAMWDSVRSTGTWQGEIWNRRKNGEVYPELLTVTAISDNNLSVTHYVATKIDITQQKRAEEEIRNLNLDLERRVASRTVELERAKDIALAANRAKSEFLSSMSHELRTPLNAVLGFSQLLSTDPELSPEKRDSAQEIEHAGKLLLNLVSDVLELSRIESGQLEVSLESMIVKSLTADSFRLVAGSAEAANVELVDAGGNGQEAIIQVDPMRLKQIILNFLTNAIKYNRPHGSVRLSYTLSETQAPGAVRIVVEDTGIGIPADKQSRVFEAFDRLGLENGSIEGTGIGLSIAKRLVQAMGGTIGFSSIEGEGSTFWAEFPVIADLAVLPQ